MKYCFKHNSFVSLNFSMQKYTMSLLHTKEIMVFITDPKMKFIHFEILVACWFVTTTLGLICLDWLSWLEGGHITCWLEGGQLTCL